MISPSATVLTLPAIQTEACIEYIVEWWDTIFPFKSSFKTYGFFCKLSLFSRNLY